MSWNVPDDWNSHYLHCYECGTRYHASEGCETCVECDRCGGAHDPESIEDGLCRACVEREEEETDTDDDDTDDTDDLAPAAPPAPTGGPPREGSGGTPYTAGDLASDIKQELRPHD